MLIVGSDFANPANIVKVESRSKVYFYYAETKTYI